MSSLHSLAFIDEHKIAAGSLTATERAGHRRCGTILFVDSYVVSDRDRALSQLTELNIMQLARLIWATNPVRVNGPSYSTYWIRTAIS